MSKYTQGKQHSKEFASIDMISWSISYADCGKQRQSILYQSLKQKEDTMSRFEHTRYIRMQRVIKRKRTVSRL